jgi:hypothetical protein
MMRFDDFTITKETFKEVYDLAACFCEPKSIFQVALVLPFYVPFPEGIESIRAVANEGYVTIMKFRKIEYQIDCITPELVNSLTVKTMYGRQTARTFVEIAFMTMEDMVSAGAESALAGPIMNVLVKDLNLTLTAFSFLTSSTGVYPVSRNMLPYVTACQILDCTNFEPVKVGPIPTNASYEADMMLKAMKITGDQGQYIINFEVNLKTRFRTSELFAFDALRHFRNGLVKESVISINTSVESFLFSMFVEFKIIDGSDEESALKEAVNLKLHHLLSHEVHLIAKIGGNWEKKGKECECARWYTIAYKLRNDIVHSGYEPSEAEAYNALCAALLFREYVFNLVKNHDGLYKTASQHLLDFYKDSEQTFALRVFETDLTYNEDKRREMLEKSYAMTKDTPYDPDSI